MRALLLLSLIPLACGREVVDPPPQVKVPVETEELPEPPPDLPPEPKVEVMVDEAYELGRRRERIEQRTKEAKKDLAEMSMIVAFIRCLEEHTGKKIRGDDGTLERYMRGKHGRACRKEVLAMGEDEVTKYAAEAIPE